MSWERRMEQWKKLPDNQENVDAWFESLSAPEREDAFFESKTFQVFVHELLSYINQKKEIENKKRLREKLKFLPWKKIDNQNLKQYLMNIFFHTPSLLAQIHENKNVALDFDTILSLTGDRLYDVIECEASGEVVPEGAYNLGQAWNSPFSEGKNTL